jgi:hypothetical protein
MLSNLDVKDLQNRHLRWSVLLAANSGYTCAPAISVFIGRVDNRIAARLEGKGAPVPRKI